MGKIKVDDGFSSHMIGGQFVPVLNFHKSRAVLLEYSLLREARAGINIIIILPHSVLS